MQGMVLWACGVMVMVVVVAVILVVVVVVVVVVMVVVVIAMVVLWPPLSCSLFLQQQWSVSASPTPCPRFETHLPLLSSPPPHSTREWTPSFAATCLDECVRGGFVSTTFHGVPSLFVDPGWNRCPVKSNKQ